MCVMLYGNTVFNTLTILLGNRGHPVPLYSPVQRAYTNPVEIFVLMIDVSCMSAAFVWQYMSSF